MPNKLFNILMYLFFSVAAVTAFRDWWIVIGVGVLVVGTSVVVIVRVRITRRRSLQPVQLPTVSSYTEDIRPQRTYVLRQVPRSPRRRGVDTHDSVTLFAVDDDEL